MKATWCVVILCVAVLGDELYPDITCQDGYQPKDHVVKVNNITKHSRGGEYYVKRANDQCNKRKDDENFCLKRCVLDKLHFLNAINSPTDKAPKDIELFFNPLEKGMEFTKKMKTACAASYKEVELHETCAEWDPFFECLDKVFDDCKGSLA